MMATAPPDDPPAAPAWDDALVALHREQYAPLARLAYLLTDDAGRAEEVVQDAFVRAQRAWARVREPLPYLRAAVVNGCRSLGRRDRVARAHPPPAPDPATQEPDEMWDAIARLPERQRAVVVLRYWADLPHAEIAALLGCPPATVRTALHRALARLREEIEP
jgi:RNA polymerase sigma-70 factor (sigma-E family)